MGRKKRSEDVPEERKRCIVDMANAGLTHAHIATYYSMPRSAVPNVIRRNKLSYTASIQKTGRKNKLSDRDLCCLQKYARNARFKPLHMILAELNLILASKYARTLRENTWIRAVYVIMLQF